MASLILQIQGSEVPHDLREGENLVGRHPDCFVSVVEPSVSGRRDDSWRSGLLLS
jgi:hypothetical protein